MAIGLLVLHQKGEIKNREKHGWRSKSTVFCFLASLGRLDAPMGKQYNHPEEISEGEPV